MAKKVTIKDIAHKAKVSKSTVSRVLNETTPVNEQKKAAILAAMEQLNYKPNVFARGLAGGHSMTIGVVTQNIGSPFYDSVTQGVIRTLSGTDYSPIFVDGQWKQEVEKSAITTLLDRQIDGLILIGGKLSSTELDLLCEDLPAVMVGRMAAGWESKSISIDNVQAGYQATKHLIDLGHDEIAHLSGIKNHDDASARMTGYKKALTEHGIEVSEDRIYEGNFSSQSGVLGIESLLLRGISFSAVFAANDEMAFGARLALYRKGIRVPEDVSIVGFDNQPVSAFLTPPLTTVAQPAMKMGSAAADLLLHQLRNEEFKLPEFNFEIIVRESVVSRNS